MPHRIFGHKIYLHSPPQRCDFSKNRIAMPVDYLCSWCRRTETWRINFDQRAREGSRLFKNFCEIGTLAWLEVSRKSTEAYRGLIWIVNSKFVIGFDKTSKEHTCHGKEIKDCCISQFQVSITLGSINSFVFGERDEIIQRKSISGEE
jgi:hypothetical protein